MAGLCIWLYWYYVICVIHRLYLVGSCNIMLFPLSHYKILLVTLQLFLQITRTHSNGWHNHISLPCAASYYYSSLYHLRNCSLPKFTLHAITAGKHAATIFTHQATQQAASQPASDYKCEIPAQSFSLLNYNHYCIWYEYVYTFGNRIPYLAWQVAIYGTHTTRPYPAKIPSNTSNAQKTSQTLGMAVASLTHVKYYTDRLTGFACFSWTPCSYNTHACTKTNHPARVQYTKRINSQLHVLHSAHVPTTVAALHLAWIINDNIYQPTICVMRRPTTMRVTMMQQLYRRMIVVCLDA